MDTQPVWETILNIPIGTIVAWITVIAAIITAIITTTIKFYKVFSKVKALRDADLEKAEKLQKHDELMGVIEERLARIQSALDEQKEVNLKQVRYQIVHTCDEALSLGYISAGKLKSLEEIYEEYTNVFHGNGYVATMMQKVRELEVRGGLYE